MRYRDLQGHYTSFEIWEQLQGEYLAGTSPRAPRIEPTTPADRRLLAAWRREAREEARQERERAKERAREEEERQVLREEFAREAAFSATEEGADQSVEGDEDAAYFDSGEGDEDDDGAPDRGGVWDDEGAEAGGGEDAPDLTSEFPSSDFELERQNDLWEMWNNLDITDAEYAQYDTGEDDY